MSFDNDISHVAKVLPRTNLELKHLIRIVFVGKTEKDTDIKIPKTFDVRKSQIEGTLKFLCEYNEAYKDIVVDYDRIQNEEYEPHYDKTDEQDNLDRFIPDTNKLEVKKYSKCKLTKSIDRR